MTDSATATQPTQSTLEATVVRTLRVGIYASAACLLVGLVAIAVQSLSGAPIDLTFTPRTVGDIVAVVAGFSPAGLVTLGLLGLMLTQGAILLTTLAFFGRQRDRAFSLISLVLLLILAAGAVAGQTH